MTEGMESIEVRLNDILSQAIDLTENKTLYVNNVHFSVGANEVSLDLYYMGADPKFVGKPEFQAQRLARVVLPLGIAKEVSELLAKSLSRWEDTFGITLPIMPSTGSDQELVDERGGTSG